MANKYEKKPQANFVEPINTQYARTFTRKYIHKEFTVYTVHNFHQFENVEWNKLVQTES